MDKSDEGRSVIDRTDEVGKEGICSVCGQEKLIKASWHEQVFCEECFDKNSKNLD